MAKGDTVTFEKNTPHFHLLPTCMPKVDQSLLGIYEVLHLH